MSVVLLFLLLLVALLFLRTRLVLRSFKNEGNQIQVVIFRCLGGSLEGSFEFVRESGRFAFRVLGASVWRTDLGRGEARPAKRKEPRKPPAVPRDIGLLRAFLGAVRRFLQDALKAVSFEGFFCRLRMGLGDPAWTGVIFGMSYPVIGMIRSSFPRGEVDLELEPEWMESRFEVSARGTLGFRLASLVIPLIRFFLNGSVRRFLRLMK